MGARDLALLLAGAAVTLAACIEVGLCCDAERTEPARPQVAFELPVTDKAACEMAAFDVNSEVDE